MTSPLKTGANQSDQVKIAKFLEQGYSAKDIGEMLYMMPEVVERFTPKKQDDGKKKTKDANAKAEAAHKDIMDKKK
jgi:hypothetical protein